MLFFLLLLLTAINKTDKACPCGVYVNIELTGGNEGAVKESKQV